MKKPVEFTVENQTLRGNFYIPEGIQKPPAVILFHGSGGTGKNLTPLAEKLVNNGIFAFFFHFRGCGESDGLYKDQTIGNALKDARRGFDFLLEQNVDHDRIGVLGSSFGGSLATLIMPEYPIKSLILKAPSASTRPFNSLIDIGSEEEEHNFFFYHPEKWEKAENFKNISKFSGSLLLIEGSRDNIIPHSLIQEYYDRATLARIKKIEVIREADHRLSEEKWVSEFVNLSLEWFMMTL